MATTPTYAAYGHVRGDCGHRHRSIRTAVACERRDNAACGRVAAGSYSDRRVMRRDGLKTVHLNEAERIVVDGEMARWD